MSDPVFTYATVCSGVEGCSLALNAAPPTRGAWEPVFFSEIAPFPSAVLAHRFPSVPNLGDMTQIKVTDEGITNGSATIPFHGRLDLLAGGTPCQDFSVAGRRAGGGQGSGTRSSLCWEWLRLVSELAPRVVLWENVPGCLSTHNGADFSRLVAALGDLGYGCAWRVLDCQYSRVDVWPMAIPQRRRRVWLVGVADADVDGAAEVLFEPSCLLGRAKPERASGASLAACAGGRPAGASGTIRVRSGCPGGGKGALVSEERALALATGNDLSVYNFELTTNGVQMSACRAGDNLVYPRGRAMSGEVYPCLAAGLRKGQNNQWASSGQPIIEPTYPALTCATQQLGNAEIETGGLVLASINGHVINRKPENGGNSCGHGSGEVMLTETATDVHAVAVLDPGHCKTGEVTGTLIGNHESRISDASNVVVGFAYKQGANAKGAAAHEDECPTLRGGQPDTAVSASSCVRRLTPEECEALMGYPVGHTKVPYRGKPAEACPDGPRYEACGNGWAINSARWVLLGIHRYLFNHQQKEHDNE